MTDLIKNEAEFIRNCATDIETGEPLDDDQICNMYVIDAHRIADLIDAVEERNKELTMQLLAAHGQAADALDKLNKAGTVALETILNDRGPVFDAMVDAAEDAAGKDVSFNVVVGRAIRAALSELEKTE